MGACLFFAPFQLSCIIRDWLREKRVNKIKVILLRIDLREKWISLADFNNYSKKKTDTERDCERDIDCEMLGWPLMTLYNLVKTR